MNGRRRQRSNDRVSAAEAEAASGLLRIPGGEARSGRTAPRLLSARARRHSFGLVQRLLGLGQGLDSVQVPAVHGDARAGECRPVA